MQTWHDLRLIRVIAPAGYGKSTLAAAWARTLAALTDEQRPVVTWLSLFEDLNAERYLRALIDALLPALPPLQAMRPLDGSGEYSLAQRVRMLCTELSAAPHPIVLVIDDYHLLTDPAVHDVTQQIIDAGEHRCLLMLLSRTTPPLQLDRLILDDAVLTLSERDLTFDHEEFLAFVELMGMSSQPAAVLDDLEQRCTGWVTALKLLAYDLQHPTPAAPHSHSAGHTASSLRHFIQSRILDSLPAALREFARSAAVFPWMSADLMAVVTGASSESCAQMLADLVSASAFVTEFIDHSGEPRFRFHPLVLEALRRSAVVQPEQQRRAAAWFCDHDEVDVALAVLDDKRPTTDDAHPPSASVVNSLARAIRRALLRFDVTAAQRWLNALPTSLLAAHPPLAVDATWAAYFAESIPQLDDALTRAQAALRTCSGGEATHDLHAEAAMLNAYRHMLHGRMEEAERTLSSVEAMPQSEHSLGNGYLHFFRALLPRNPGDFDARIRSLQVSADVFERVGHPYGVIVALYSQVLLKIRYGDLRGALTSSEFLQNFAARRNRSRHIHVRSDLVTQGEVLYMLNRTDEARAMMQRVVAAAERDDAQIGNLFIARTYLDLCDAAQAADPSRIVRHDDAADSAQWTRILELDFDALRGLIAWPRILRDSRTSQPERCRQTVESMGFASTDLSTRAHDTVRMAVLGGAVLGERDTPHLMGQLDDFLTHLDAIHFRYMAMHVRLLRVLHAQRHGQESVALERLKQLLPEVEHSSMLRLILDFPILRPLLQQCGDPFARHLLALFPNPPAAPTQKSPDFGLTDQETRILAQLSQGLTTKKIAAAHTLSHKTIYSHIYRIFRKLGVNSRDDAVRVWRGEEIVDSG